MADLFIGANFPAQDQNRTEGAPGPKMLRDVSENSGQSTFCDRDSDTVLQANPEQGQECGALTTAVTGAKEPHGGAFLDNISPEDLSLGACPAHGDTALQAPPVVTFAELWRAITGQKGEEAGPEGNRLFQKLGSILPGKWTHLVQDVRFLPHASALHPLPLAKGSDHHLSSLTAKSTQGTNDRHFSQDGPDNACMTPFQDARPKDPRLSSWDPAIVWICRARIPDQVKQMWDRAMAQGVRWVFLDPQILDQLEAQGWTARRQWVKSDGNSILGDRVWIADGRPSESGNHRHQDQSIHNAGIADAAVVVVGWVIPDIFGLQESVGACGSQTGPGQNTGDAGGEWQGVSNRNCALACGDPNLLKTQAQGLSSAVGEDRYGLDTQRLDLAYAPPRDLEDGPQQEAYGRLIRLYNLFHPHIPPHRVAVTGTDGKTSTSQFFWQLCQHLGYDVVAMGTMGVHATRPLQNAIPVPQEAGWTTYPSDLFWNILDKAGQAGISHAVWEASSHGLDQKRTEPIQARVGIWTTFSQDHLDYHATLEAYFQAKARLLACGVDGAALCHIRLWPYRAVLFEVCRRAARLRPGTSVALIWYGDVDSFEDEAPGTLWTSPDPLQKLHPHSIQEYPHAIQDAFSHGMRDSKVWTHAGADHAAPPCQLVDPGPGTEKFGGVLNVATSCAGSGVSQSEGAAPLASLCTSHQGHRPAQESAHKKDMQSQHSALCLDAAFDSVSLDPQAMSPRIIFHILQRSGESTDVRIDFGRGRTWCGRIPLVGDFQIANVVAAASALWLQGESLDRIGDALGAIRPVLGRLECMGTYRGGTVYVDFAHTPQGLETLLQAMRPLAAGSLGIVFGCGGDRDPDKRSLMGHIAARLADWVIITDDNPRTEDPVAIRAAILSSCPGAIAIPDRRQAITAAMDRLGPGDILIIAGKGHETGQIIGDRITPFSDQDEVRRILSPSA